MKVERKDIAIKTLWNQKEKTLLNPAWQRGPVWQKPRQVLLIDSILREMDFPKIYMRRLPAGNAYNFDVVDGQQRLRTVFMFRDDKLALDAAGLLPPVNGVKIQGLTYSQLPPPLKKRFDQFAISVVEIVSATRSEVNEMFARLQMGVALNPAELRNAMLSPLRDVVDATATAHPFFINSRIPDARYKRQDYVAHIFAVLTYDGQKDIKAPNLRQMYLDFVDKKPTEIQRLNGKVERALAVIEQVDSFLKYKIRDKWIFVDLCWTICQMQASKSFSSAQDLAAKFQAFDAMRRANRARPEALLRARGSSADLRRNQLLYEYIQSFQRQGATRISLAARNRSLIAFLK
ncbi:MAG: DUF262 domain-containing protein [Devosia sp.]